MSAQGIPLKADFRERARVNDIPVARLIGFEAKEIADGRATVILAAADVVVVEFIFACDRCAERIRAATGHQGAKIGNKPSIP